MTPVLRRVENWSKRTVVAREERDRCIKWARSEGHSWREIGEAAGLSHQAIRKIVARERSETQ